MAYDIVKWAKKYFPAFRFSKGPDGSSEVFYPVEVESWLTHKASSTQEDLHRRGTALYRWRAQGPDPDDTPEKWKEQEPVILPGEIKLNAGPKGIDNSKFETRPPADPGVPSHPDKPDTWSNGDWYLDFGGWNDPGTRSSGQMGYNWTVYKGLYEELGLPAGSLPPEPDGHPQDLANADPATFNPNRQALHAYVEFASLEKILKDLLEVDLPSELADLQEERKVLKGAAAELTNILSLTYYLFYPVYAPPDGKLMEGQWEAVSVFLRDQGGENLILHHASFTQGYENRGISRGLYPRLVAACRAAADIEKVDNHPIVYVAWGSHANYFTPRSEWGAVQVEKPPIATPEYMAGLGLMFIASGLACMKQRGALDPSCWEAVTLGVVVLVSAAIMAIIVSIATFLFGTDSYEDYPDHEPIDQTPRNDIHRGDGEPADVNPGTPHEPPQPAEGRIPFVIHTFSEDPAITDKPDLPSWWEYVGRWGVCVDDSKAMEEGSASWSNGVWRRRPFDRYTATHCNVEALLDYLHNKIDDYTDAAYTYR